MNCAMENYLYQTIANKNRHNVESIAPFQCSKSTAWLGKGYYFWDTFIELAKEWGERVYRNNYIICKTYATYSEEEILDFVGNTTQILDLKNITLRLEKTYQTKLTIPFVINYIRKTPHFSYKAIRILSQETFSNLTSYKRFFREGKNACFNLCPSIQWCVIDKSILKLPVVVEYCSSDECNVECI